MKKYQCKVFDESLQNYLDNQINVSEFIRNILDDVRTGKLLYDSTQEDLDLKLKKLKVADLRLKIWQKVKDNGFTLEQLKAIIDGEDIPLPIKEDYTPTETTKPEPTKIQFKSLGSTITHQPKQILQEDGTLRCKRCNRFFDMQGFDCMQLDDYRKHCEEVHGGLLQEERNELMEIYPN